jgi:hypothetical protein
MAFSSAGAVALALITGWLGYMFGMRQERERERRARVFAAAAELTVPLRELQRLLRSFGRVDVEKGELTSAVLGWAKAYDDHGHRLPRDWRHVAHSVRDAVGTALGGGTLVHIRPDTADADLGDPDAMWQDFADEYLDYVARCVLEWGDASRTTPKDLMTYEEWLVRTGRREPYGSNA